MTTVFGIKIGEKTSDAEFVEKQRKMLVMSRKYAWLGLFFVVAMCIGIPKFYALVRVILPTQSGDAQKYGSWGFLLGFTFAFILLQALEGAVKYVMFGFNIANANRATLLLIKYHDILLQTARERPVGEATGPSGSKSIAQSLQKK